MAINYFKKFSQEDILDVIHHAQTQLLISLPSLHEEMYEAILHTNMSKQGIEIKVIIDFDPATFRQGYGDFQTVKGLLDHGIDVKTITDNRISFIIADNKGYFIFIESRSLIPADKPLLNVIQIDPITIVRLKHYFFDNLNDDFDDELTNAIIEESKMLNNAKSILKEEKAEVDTISQERLSKVEDDLKKNPPLKPDFKRTVAFYANKLQYVEFSFEGQNFQSTKINIPPKAMPYNNPEIKKKLVTKLKLFESIEESKAFTAFTELKDRKKEIANLYLVPLTLRKGKSVIRVIDTQDFIRNVQELQQALVKAQSELYGILKEEIDIAITSMQHTLKLFYLENPTEDMKMMGKSNYQMMAENLSKSTVHHIKFPDPMHWIKNLSIKYFFSDITFEDLKNRELLEELHKKEVIEEADIKYLTDFGKGIGID
jgi:hypothetical protein